MRHHLGGEEVHVSPCEIIRKDAKLEECHQDAEAGTLAHPLDPRQYRIGASDEGCATLNEGFSGQLAATKRGAVADEILHRADRGVAGWHQHLKALTQKIVKECLDRPPCLLARPLIALSNIDRASPPELLRRWLVAVLPRLVAIGVVVARDEVSR